MTPRRARPYAWRRCSPRQRRGAPAAGAGGRGAVDRACRGRPRRAGDRRRCGRTSRKRREHRRDGCQLGSVRRTAQHPQQRRRAAHRGAGRGAAVLAALAAHSGMFPCFFGRLLSALAAQRPQRPDDLYAGLVREDHARPRSRARPRCRGWRGGRRNR